MARPSELSDQIFVVKELRKAGIAFAAVPNGGRRDRREAARLKASGVRPGVPDILIFDNPPKRPESHSAALEMKREGSTPSAVSAPQREWLQRLEGCGWATVVGNGAQDA